MKILRSGQAAIIEPEDWIRMKRNVKDEVFKIFLYVAYLTGERWGAICQMKVSDVDFDRGHLVFRRVTRKGKDRSRVMPIHPELLPVLQGWRPATEWLFPAPRDPNSHLPLRTADAKLRALIERCGLEKKGISGHSFRRTFITRLDRAGYRPRVIQELTGHQSIQCLMRYVEVDPAQVEAALVSLTA